MKKVISGLVLAFTLMMSAQTLADPSAQSMNAIKAKDWQQAEKSLSQDLKVNRKDAITWYFRAQVLNHLQRPDDALKCLDNVQKIDPSFRPSQVADLRQKLNRNSQIVANSKATGKPVITSSSVENKQVQIARSTPSQTVPVSRDHYTDTTVPKSSIQAKNENSSGGGSFLSVVLGLFILCGIGFVGYLFVSKKKTSDETKKVKEDLIAKLVKANKSLSEKRDMLELKNQESSYLYKRMGTLLSEVDNHTRKIKDGSYDTYAVSSTLDEVRDAENRFQNSDYDAPVAAAKTYSEPAVSQPRSQPSASRTTSSYNPPRQTHHSHRHDYDSNRGGNTTIINNGNSNNDLLTTVATTAILSDIINNNHHDTVREREVIREVPAYDDREDKDDFSLNDSSNTYNDSSDRDDFSLSNDNDNDDFNTGSSDDSYSSNDNDDDFKL